jgi:hypothetical protein
VKLPRRRPLAIAAALLVVTVLAAGGLWWTGRSGDPRPVLAPWRTVRAPEGTRIRVQVLNATETRGLGRRATRHLRDRGFDVVEIGTAPAADRRDSTLVLDRSGHPEWARLVAEVLGGAAVEARPDTSRYLDVTVLLGASYRPPAEPLHP